MTDLKMTKLCAEAMGFQVIGGDFHCWYDDKNEQHLGAYEPLHDDAQAMALVKKLHISIGHLQSKRWIAHKDGIEVWNESLNRAIVECVAKIQEAR